MGVYNVIMIESWKMGYAFVWKDIMKKMELVNHVIIHVKLVSKQDFQSVLHVKEIENSTEGFVTVH